MINLKLSLFKGKNDNEPEEVTRTWKEFCSRLAKPVVRADKDGTLFSPATFEPKARKKENVTELSMLALDCDHCNTIAADLPRWRKLGWGFAVYTTHSHKRITESNPNAEERFRIALPLVEPIPAVYYPALWAWAFQASGEKLDPAPKALSQMFYTPAKASGDAEYYYEIHNGPPLNWRELPALKYVVSAFENEMSALSSAPNGSRNQQLFKAAAALGELIAGDMLVEDRVVKALEEAAAKIGLESKEITPTIQSGLRSGRQKPRRPDGFDKQPKPGAEPKKAEKKTEGDAEAGRQTQADMLIEIAKGVALCHSVEEDLGYAHITVNDHQETHRIHSKAFRQYLMREFYKQYAKIPNSEAAQNALNYLDGRARFDSPAADVYLRLAAHDGKVYWDLANDAWQILEISAGGWRVIEAKDAPVRFRRSKGMLAIPAPVKGGDLAALQRFVNYPDDAAWALHATWLVAALRARARAFPILILNGEQGSAKSTASKMTRVLIDPNVADLRPKPREDRDLYIAARNGWVCAFDNLSGLPRDFSDALCRLATGAGFGTRELYENDEECLFNAARPIIVNGIDDLAEKADLIDRGVFIELPPIPDEERKDEETLWAEFERERPKLIGALADAVARALKNLPNVNLAKLPRMADFAKWGAAANVGGDQVFLEAYTGNRAQASDLAILASDVAAYVAEWYESQDPLTVTLTELLGELTGRVRAKEAKLQNCKPEKVKLPRGWPTTERKFGNELRRCAPNLRRLGIEVLDAGLDSQTRKAKRIFQRCAPNGGVSNASEASEASAGSQVAEDEEIENAKDMRRVDGAPSPEPSLRRFETDAETEASHTLRTHNPHNGNGLNGGAKGAKGAKVSIPAHSGSVPADNPNITPPGWEPQF